MMEDAQQLSGFYSFSAVVEITVSAALVEAAVEIPTQFFGFYLFCAAVETEILSSKIHSGCQNTLI